jgi:hypothetical protein
MAKGAIIIIVILILGALYTILPTRQGSQSTFFNIYMM